MRKKGTRVSVQLCVFVLALITTTHLYAHEVRPAYLELHQLDSDTYDVLWKVPARGTNERLALHVRLPADCKIVTPLTAAFNGTSYIERSRIVRPSGLAGHTIAIEGLSTTLTDVLVRVERTDGTQQMLRLTPDRPSFVVEATPQPLEVAHTYLVLGVEHILFGVDHLLFVLALLILVRGRRRLLGTITAFTVAHSLTLALATLGVVHVPSAPVEAVIALSIVFVAAEIIHTLEGREGITAQQPWIVAFTFGLLHGFGFASVLSEVGLPPGHIPVALLFFNVGVELGQLLFIATVLTLVALGQHIRIPFPPWAKLVPPYVIGSVAMFWVIQRIAAF